MNEDMQKMLRHLRLYGLLQNWDKYIKISQEKDFSPVKLLQYIIEEEFKVKKENSRILRIKKARITIEYVMETFPFDRQPKLNKKKILSLYDSFNYITKKENIIFIGPAGAGKSGLATSFLMQAINRGYNGREILFPELIELLFKSRGDHTEGEVIKKFADYDCLHIDELGYIDMEPLQVGQFFTLMQKRYKKKTTFISSNLGFSKWNSLLKNEHLTSALIDRLTETSHVINLKDCVSLRETLKTD